MRNDRDYQNREGYGYGYSSRSQDRNENNRNRGDRSYIPGAGYETGNYLTEENITFTGSSPYTESDRNRDFGGAMMGRGRHEGYDRDRSGRDQGYRESRNRNYDDRYEQRGSRYGDIDRDRRDFRARDYNPNDRDLNRGHGSRDRAIRYGDENPDRYDYAMREIYTDREDRGSDRAGIVRNRNRDYSSDYRTQGGRYDRDRNYGQEERAYGDYNPNYGQGNLGGDRSRTSNPPNRNERYSQQQGYDRDRGSYYGDSGYQQERNADYEQDNFRRRSFSSDRDRNRGQGRSY